MSPSVEFRYIRTVVWTDKQCLNECQSCVLVDFSVQSPYECAGIVLVSCWHLSFLPVLLRIADTLHVITSVSKLVSSRFEIL
jgi:hypothetical protein